MCEVLAVPGTEAAATTLGVPTTVVAPERGAGSVEPAPERSPAPVPPASADAIAYVTSGSTGEPKVVVHDHASLLANIEAVAATLEIAPDDVAGVASSLAFAASFSASVPYLTRGRPVHVVDPLAGDADALGESLDRAGVTVLSCVPSVHRLLLRGRTSPVPLASLRTVVVGGEAVTSDDVQLHRDVLGDAVTLVNRYSCTETFGIAVHRVTAGAVLEPGPLPVGRPVPGREVHLADVDPATGVGRIEVLASALGRRYAGDPVRSAEVFGRAPDGRCLVRTGDLGRWRDDGLLEHRGRVDDLVKVNGVRVHLAEVRAAMRALPGVGDAVAVVDGRRLRGMVEVDPAAGSSPDPDRMRSELARVLPLAAVPASIVVVDQLPRNDRGKLERRPSPAGPAPDRAAPPAVSRPSAATPGSAAERELASLCAGMLGVDAVGLDDDLFTLGADSLMAVEILGVLHERYRLDLTPRDLLGGATVRELAAQASVRVPTRRAPGSGCLAELPGSGDGPPVLLIPGVAATPLALLPLGRLLAAAGHRVLIADLQPAPGHVARRSVEWTACEIVADLGAGHRSGVPGGLGVDEALTVVGYSVGGTTAHEVACRLAASGRQVRAPRAPRLRTTPRRRARRERRRRLDRAVTALRAGEVRSAMGQAELLVTDPLAPYLLALVDHVPAVASRRTRLSMAHGRRAAARHGRPSGRGARCSYGARPDPTVGRGGARTSPVTSTRSRSAATTSPCSTDPRSTTWRVPSSRRWRHRVGGPGRGDG